MRVVIFSDYVQKAYKEGAISLVQGFLNARKVKINGGFGFVLGLFGFYRLLYSEGSGSILFARIFFAIMHYFA